MSFRLLTTSRVTPQFPLHQTVDLLLTNCSPPPLRALHSPRLSSPPQPYMLTRASPAPYLPRTPFRRPIAAADTPTRLKNHSTTPQPPSRRCPPPSPTPAPQPPPTASPCTSAPPAASSLPTPRWHNARSTPHSASTSLSSPPSPPPSPRSRPRAPQRRRSCRGSSMLR